jgi:3-hydroxyacyl-CoA dehydrogenase/enoyl-CoA hydratase/3-hydroxybutyryl-CoA epimerase
MTRTARHIGLDVDHDQIAIVSIDLEGKGANVLNSEIMEELSLAVRKISSTREIRGVIFTSGKPRQFIAGASIDEILEIKDPTVGEEKARTGQDLMHAIEALQVPTVASIEGPTLGGGLEFALACTYRIVSDQPEVVFSLPEVKLGIIPGFGGTQRLPELVGLINSIDLITSGRTINAVQAYKLGLIDDIAPKELLISVAKKWIDKGTRLRKPRKQKFATKVMEKFPLTRKWIFHSAHKKIMAATQGHYPAPIRALEVIQKTFNTHDNFRYDLEAQKIGSLIASPISKSLIGLFQATEKIRKTQHSLPPQPIHKVGVLGAGVMGSGIAHLLSSKEKSVRLRDLTSPILLNAMQLISGLFDKERKRKRESRRWYDLRMNRISTTKDFSGFSNTQMVFEAIVEKLEVKQQVLGECAQNLSRDAIIATNTSALSISAIASAIPNPERVIGLHFFNPVAKMPLVEIIQGEQTSVQTIATTMHLAITLGKTPIVVADRPGFLVNRILGVYLSEAIRIAEEGFSVKDIEKCAKDFGLPMGPFELMDEVGIDVASNVGKYLADSFAYFPRPSTLLQSLINAKRFGKKSGAGFYIHSKRGKKLDSSFLIKQLGLTTKSKSEDPEINRIITDRMILIMVNESYRCLQEQIVQTEADVNIGMIFGTGFPPFRGGPIAFAKSRGLNNIMIRLQELTKYGEHFKPCERLKSAVSDTQS